MNIITYLALGSNSGDPAEQLNKAIESLKKLPSSVLQKVSSFYQSPFQDPAPGTVQADCINAVVELQTELSPFDLLKAIQQIENAQGRIRTATKNIARTLDLDIILYGNRIMETPEITIPHPKLQERAFVLIPLYEIAPDLILPNRKPLKQFIPKKTEALLKKVLY